MAGWTLEPDYRHLAADFGSLDSVFALEGERLTRDPLSEVIRIERDGVRYYVKRYRSAGKGLRRYLARPRSQGRWQNLKRFEKWGIPTAEVVAWGLERKAGAFQRGAMITRELPGTEDLSVLACNRDPRLKDPRWVDGVSRQIAKATRLMHDQHFTHNDLKWRNLLVDDQPLVYFIDCRTARSGGASCCAIGSPRTWPAWTRWPSTTCRAPSACASTCNIAVAGT